MFLLDGLRQLLSSLMAFSLIRRVVKFGCSDLLSWQAIVLCLKLVVCDCLLGKVVVLTLVCLGCSDFSLPLNDFVQLVESQVGVRGVRAISFLSLSKHQLWGSLCLFILGREIPFSSHSKELFG
jgi:hypothetical protein